MPHDPYLQVHDVLLALTAQYTIPDTEFVVNLHDYNKAILPGP